MPDDQILDETAREQLPEYSNPNPGWKNFLRQNKIVIAAVAGAIIVVGLVWFFLAQRSAPTPTSSNVVLQVKGPEKITSGNEAEYTIVYRNGENADLVNVSLDLLYPSGFKFKSATPGSVSAAGTSFNLPIVKQGADGKIVIRGKLSGGTGEDKELKAILHYRLSNFNSEFVVSESTHTTILAPDLILDINGPVDVVNGQDTTFSVTITNVSGQSFDNLAVQLSYPDGFSFTSSNIPPTKDNNYWKLNPLLTSVSQSLEITGSFTGEDREEKLMRADLGQIINNNFAPQITATASFTVIPSSLSLSIQASPENYVKLGDTISYKLKYMNRGPIGLSNLVISTDLEGPSIDYSRIASSNAIVTNHTLTWKAATLSNLSLLAPNEQGEINFSVPLKTSFATNLKNQTILASSSIVSDEMNKPTKAADLELKVISQLDLAVNGDYISGAAPMQVGQTTLFAMTFLLTNYSNDVNNTEVVASLPLPSSAWKNVIIPDSESSRLTFDSSSGIIHWKIGTLAAFTGKFIPVLKVTFQLAVTPTESDKDKPMNLLSNISASGIDSFVNQTISSAKITNISTADIDDPALQDATVK